jgi:hypothetical protein
MFHPWRSPLLMIVVVSAAACGPSRPPAEAPAEPAAAGQAPTGETDVATAPPSARVAWADMTAEEKKYHMKEVVLPRMRELLQEHDPDEFAEVNCATCHGAGAKEGKFEMPNAGLPKLDPRDGFARHKKEEPAMIKFMMERVTPEMVKLLDVAPYDPQTQQGFGCFNCHTMADG